MNTKDGLGDRMKRYEQVSTSHLTGRMPMIIRVDGNCFHSLTKRWNCTTPFDSQLRNAMVCTMLDLCKNIQGAVIGYTQSDEISIGVVDYQTLTSDAWFDKNVQKMVSVAAGMATKAFNWARHTYTSHADELAWFDARAFVLPKEETCNYFLWRQQDATRNSIQMAARAVLSHKKCTGLNCNQLQDAMHARGINWNDYSAADKRGVCAVKVPVLLAEGKTRLKWKLDFEIPVFSADRAYVENRFEVPEEPGKDNEV